MGPRGAVGPARSKKGPRREGRRGPAQLALWRQRSHARPEHGGPTGQRSFCIAAAAARCFWRLRFLIFRPGHGPQVAERYANAPGRSPPAGVCDGVWRVCEHWRRHRRPAAHLPDLGGRAGGRDRGGRARCAGPRPAAAYLPRLPPCRTSTGAGERTITACMLAHPAPAPKQTPAVWVCEEGERRGQGWGRGQGARRLHRRRQGQVCR